MAPLGGFADPLALPRPERLAGVEEVALALVLRDKCPREVAPGAQNAHDRRSRARVVLAHVAVAAALELHDAASRAGGVGGELIVVDRVRGRHPEDPPADAAQA